MAGYRDLIPFTTAMFEAGITVPEDDPMFDDD